MRKIFQLTTLFVIAAGLVVSCTEPTDNGLSSFNAPTDLRTGTLMATAAYLAWTDGGLAEKYNVVINDGEPITVLSVSHIVTDLTAETSYAWKVQAVRGNHVSAWVEGPVFTTPKKGVTVVPPPTDLEIVAVTHNSARFSFWGGYIDYFEIVINDSKSIWGTTCTYDLTPETTYKWKVRVNKNDVWSEWTQGEDFTTRKDTGNTQFLTCLYEYQGNYFGNGTEVYNFYFTETDFDYHARDYVGFGFDVCFSGIELGMHPNNQWLNMPNTTYNVVLNSDAPGVNTINTDHGGIVIWTVNSGQQQFYDITGGSMTVKGNHVNGYNIIFEFTYEGGTFRAEYNGNIRMKNPKYPPAGEPVDFGTLTNVYRMSPIDIIDYQSWSLQAGSSDMYYYGENDWRVYCHILAPLNSGMAMPDGMYNIDSSNEPWSVTSRGGTAMAIVYLENGIIQKVWYPTSGTLKSTYSDGEYTIIIDGKTDNGTIVSGTLKFMAPYGYYAPDVTDGNKGWRPFGGMTDASVVPDIAPAPDCFRLNPRNDAFSN